MKSWQNCPAQPRLPAAKSNFSFTLSALDEGLAVRLVRSGQEAVIFETSEFEIIGEEEIDSWQSKS
jgi:hypothetical protein